MTGKLKQLALIATLVTSGAVSVDATIYDGTELSPREIRMEKRAEKIDVRQKGDTVEASLPWVDQPGIKVKYNLGEITAKERLLDRRNQEALIDNTSFGDGGVKFDIILNEKPSTNQFCYTIEGAEDYIFAYQGELTPREVADGAVRPDNIVGSYAVYHKSLANNQYKTGKAFHIERPKVWSLSDDTNKQLATLSYSEGQLCVTAPQAFLDTADYPVRIDPTLGYTSVGATENSLSNIIAEIPFSTTIPISDILSVEQYSYVLSGTGTSSAGIYTASTTEFGAKTLGTSTKAVLNTTPQWVSLPFDGTYGVGTSTLFIVYYATSSVTGATNAKERYDITKQANIRVMSSYTTWTYPLSNMLNATNMSSVGGYTYSVYITYATTTPTCDMRTTVCGERKLITNSRTTDHGNVGPKIVVTSSSSMFTLFETGDYNGMTTGPSVFAQTNSAFENPFPISMVDFANSVDTIAYSLWLSSWTKSDSIEKIHVSTLDTGVDDTYYTEIMNLGETASSSASVVGTTQGASATVGGNYTAITMAENGDLFMASADTSDSWVVKCNATSTGCRNSSNWYENGIAGLGGAFRSRGDDVPLLSPIGGTNNIMLIYWDVSLDTINYNIWSATSSSWFNATQTVATAIEDNTTYGGQMISVAYASTTGKTYLAVVDDANDYITEDHDIRVWSYASSTGWVALTNPVTDATGGLTGVNISINTNNGYIFCSYVRRSTIGTATTGGVYYKMSTDGGSTWSAENTIIATGRNYTNFGGAPVSNWQQTVTYKDATTDSFYVNTFWVASSTPSGGVSTPLYIEDVYFLQ